jgi:hypothetical protein
MGSYPFHVFGFSALGHAILVTRSAGQYDHVYCEADRCFVDLVRVQKVQRLLGNLNPQIMILTLQLRVSY